MKTKSQFCYSIVSSLIVLFVYLAISLSNNESYSVSEENGADIKSSEQGNFQVYKLLVGHKAYPIKYTIQGGQLKNLSIIDADRINITIDAISPGQIVLQIPKNLISRQISTFVSSFDKISNKETDFPDLRTFTFDFKKGKQSLEIEGIIHVPDFLSKNIPEKNYDGNKPDVIPISSTLNQDNLSNRTPEDIPKTMWLEDPGFSNYNLSLRSIINNGEFTVKEGIKSTTAKVTDWNPSLIFEFPKQELKLGLVKIKNLIIGQHRLYKNPNQILTNVQYWKNVPLNEEVVLRLNNRGSNFILAEVLFSNGVSALYGGDLTVDASETKSNAKYWFKKDRPEDRKLIVKESKLPKDFETSPERLFWQAAQESFCGALSQNGFHVCNG